MISGKLNARKVCDCGVEQVGAVRPECASSSDIIIAGIVYYFVHGFEYREKGTDFPAFFAAARMVGEGYGHQLYDFQAQEQFQIRYVGRTGDYYIHPPFETLLFLPICLWSLPTAYLLWCILNVAVLVYTAIVFQRHLFKRLEWRALLPLFFLFPPVLLSFLQGQDSLLLLLIMTLAVIELRRNRNFTAGCLLGCGLIKFHIILTLVVLVASLGRKGLVRGFALVFLILFLISAGISGWAFLTAYPRFLMTLSSLPLAGIHSAAMPNIRGLASVSGIVPDTAARLAITWIGSVVLFGYAWTSFKSSRSKFVGDTNLAFGNFVLVSILVSYHLSPPRFVHRASTHRSVLAVSRGTRLDSPMGATQPAEQSVRSFPSSFACDLAGPARVLVSYRSDFDHVLAHIF